MSLVLEGSICPYKHFESEKDSARPSLHGPACLVREGRTVKVTIASSTGKREVASVNIFR